MFDFQDGRGLVPASKHPNGGGWIANSASADSAAFIGPNARVFGNAIVFGSAEVSGYAEVYGNAEVYGYAWVYGYAHVTDNAWVSGNARVLPLLNLMGIPQRKLGNGLTLSTY